MPRPSTTTTTVNARADRTGESVTSAAPECHDAPPTMKYYLSPSLGVRCASWRCCTRPAVGRPARWLSQVRHQPPTAGRPGGLGHPARGLAVAGRHVGRRREGRAADAGPGDAERPL